MATLFSCCVHQKDLAGFRCRGPGREDRAQSLSEAETLLAFLLDVQWDWELAHGVT